MLKVASFHFVVGLFFLLVTAKPQQQLPLNQEISDDSSSLENSLNLQLNEIRSPSLHDHQSENHSDAEETHVSTSSALNTETSLSNAINENLDNASSTEKPAVKNASLNNDFVINSAFEQLKNNSSENGSLPNNNEAVSPNEPSALNLISLDHAQSNPSIASFSKPAEHLIQDIPKIQALLGKPDRSSLPVKETQSTPSHTNSGSTSTKDANSVSSDNNPMKPENNNFVIPHSKRNLRRTGEVLNMKSLLNILGIIPPKPDAPLLSVSSGVSNFQIMNFKEDPKLQAISELLLAINSQDNQELLT